MVATALDDAQARGGDQALHVAVPPAAPPPRVRYC